MEERYAELITEQPLRRFLQKFCLSDGDVQNLIIVSPFISLIEGGRYGIDRICKQIAARRIPTYVITRRPEETWHQEAVDLLWQSDWIELRYNDSLHAKLYVCQEREGGYALLGSANLTQASIEKNIEIGMMIHARGRGRHLLRELSHWGGVVLRTRSQVVKQMQGERRR